MAESEDPKEELEFYFKLASPLALSLPDAEEKARAAAWLRRLGEAEAGSPRMRADYLRLLVFALQRRRLVGVFAAPPDDSQPLQPFQGGASLTEMMRRLGTQAAAERGAGDRPTVSSMLSHDLKHFLAVQPLPHDRGAHCYMALSPDSYPNWAAKPCDRSRRRSAPAQLQCPCAPEPPPPPCSPRSPAPATPPRSPCDCGPPAAPARAGAPRAPTPRTCDCPPDQICWCPRGDAGPSPSPGYHFALMDSPSDSDPLDSLEFSWLNRPETSAAAQGAALRALSDACNDSSARLPALWQSQESGFEPMEWDSYHKANYCPGRAAEYGGGRVFTTASRMEVRRSEERLADGSVLALEERTAAGAATRVSPPAPGSCPASPPRGASAAVGATERRVTWSPPPAASTPCECPSSRRRLALPYSPPSPISSPCRRSRTQSPTCSMTPDSLEVSRSRRARRRSLRSPRRSYSAESIVPCPASGRQLDSVTPPSGLRFSDSAGLSPCPCASPQPCPAARRRTSSPRAVCPAACGSGIDSVTPPSGLFSDSTCGSRSGGGIDSVTPPSGLFSGSPCSPKRRSRSRSPPCSPAPCAPPPCSPDPYSNLRMPRRFFEPVRGRRSPSPCAPARRSRSPCAPTPCSPPPCSPYGNIPMPKRFFEPLGRRSSTPPPCAPSPCSPPPCAPAPCAPPPCSPDPYANVPRPNRYFSPLIDLPKSPSFLYDEDPFYGLGDSPCALPSPSRSRSPCPCPTPSPSPKPCSPRLRGSVPKGFYRLTEDRSPRRTGECPARSPQPVCGSPPPAPCPATTTCEVECTPGGVVRRSYSRDCTSSTVPDGRGSVTKASSASFAMASPSPDPNPEDFATEPQPSSPCPLWDSLETDPRNVMPSFSGEDPFAFLDRSCNRFDYPPDDTFYEFENMPCPAAESTRYFSNTPCSSSQSPSPGDVSEASPQAPPQAPQQAPYFFDPLPMWEEMAQQMADQLNYHEDPAVYPWSFLDRTVPSFSWPPIHPRRRRR